MLYRQAARGRLHPMRRPLFVIGFTLILAACLVPSRQTSPVASPSSSRNFGSSASSSWRSSRHTSSSSQPNIALAVEHLSGSTVQFGRPDTEHELTVFLNFSSPLSRTFHDEHLPRLLTDFVRPGTLRVRIIPLPLHVYQRSDEQIAFLTCGLEQGKGLEAMDALFDAGQSGRMPAAQDAMLDPKKLATCLKSDVASDSIKRLHTLAEAFDVHLVPTFSFDAALWSGLPTYAELRGRLEDGKQAKGQNDDF